MRKKNYIDIIESWLWLFIDTMDKVSLRTGNASGIAPKGVKIIFDRYGENEDGSENLNALTFAIFVHKDSFRRFLNLCEVNYCHRMPGRSNPKLQKLY